MDLAPTDEADKAGIYSEAIRFAMNNPKISNIAITGPYGSGKSSIIQSFLKTYQCSPLHISLATFIPEDDAKAENVGRHEIERSILQQMLYGADANKLPLSRFKRIRSPGFGSIFKSLYITLGVLAFWYVLNHREEIINGTYFTPIVLENGVNLGVFAFAVTFLWATLHHFYIASFGLSLKSFSLKNVEIKPAHDDETSILNRHLDEIVYFFQSTNYDLVIIEDLDRFNESDIFVTLREINNLVNESAGVNRRIRFLYALRDDMFANTERTKFFEFIIPVIPIINTSNSIDMVLKQGKRLELDDRLDRQFLREVSRYLNDLRLIQNIFNEYSIYVANLETDGESLLDANKLLSVLIYKNVYPRDFERLHRGEGALAKILNVQDELIRQGEAAYRTEIAKLEDQLQTAERQTPSDLRELRQIYAMTLVEMLPPNAMSVGNNQNVQIQLTELAGHELFEQLIQTEQVYYRSPHDRYVSNVYISSLQTKVNPHKTYQQRKEEIERKSEESKTKIFRTIRELRPKVATLRTTKLNEMLRLNAGRVQELFEGFGESGELARFLILEGYLDDTYYQYSSLFHSGRLSPNDNKFLIQIRAFITPPADFQIDNPQEVIAAMREEDFRQSYALNITLVDSLMSDQGRYQSQTQKFFEYIMAEFGSCEEFLDIYYTSGSNTVELLSGLANTWNRLVPTALASSNNTIHISKLIASLPQISLKSLARDFDELPNFVSENLPEILMFLPELDPERLVSLNFEVREFAAIKEHSEVVESMYEEGLFELTLANLEYIYQVILGEEELEALHKKNYTTIHSTNSAVLANIVERDFNHYLHNILLALPYNSEEDVSAILSVLHHTEVEHNSLQKFLERQSAQLPTLEGVPEKLYKMLFELSMIIPTWESCVTFMESEDFETENLVNYLDQDIVRTVILEQAIPSDSDSCNLHHFLLNANSLSEVSYKEYVHALPKSFNSFPEDVAPHKLKILIDERKVEFTESTFSELTDHRDLQVLFVSTNIYKYLAEADSFALDDDFLEELLHSEISHANKIKTIELMDLDSLINLSDRAAHIGSLLINPEVNLSKVDGDVAQSLIKHSKPVSTQILLLNKYHSLIPNGEVQSILADLPRPFSEIKTGYNTPKLHCQKTYRKI
ncbi:ATP-binding protein [Vibrio sp. 10N.247.310.34]|uniref:YobI family P-loop NTPase n=1 Tax=Vibrio sp. 10N.247.310.34 TaxID=3229982 RepID=UPI0035503B15